MWGLLAGGVWGVFTVGAEARVPPGPAPSLHDREGPVGFWDGRRHTPSSLLHTHTHTYLLPMYLCMHNWPLKAGLSGKKENIFLREEKSKYETSFSHLLCMYTTHGGHGPVVGHEVASSFFCARLG
jgi:hypothetical protein